MSDVVRAEFAKRFTQALAEAGFGDTTLKELGQLFGVTHQAVRKWMNAEAMPSSARAKTVAEILGVRRAWLLDGEVPMREVHIEIKEPKSKHTNGSEVSISSDEFKLIREYRGLPSALQDSFLSIVTHTAKALRSKSARKK